MTLLVNIFLHRNYALNFSILKILPIFRDIYQNSFLCKHKIKFYVKYLFWYILRKMGKNLKHNLYEEKYLPKGSRKCIVSEKKFILKLRFRTLSRARPHIYIIHVYVFSA